MNMKNAFSASMLKILCFTLIVGMFSLYFAYAITPEGPSALGAGTPVRRTPSSALAINTSAGNITSMSISGKTVTQSWQGFYGNVTGTITLDDAAGNTIYNWSLPDPRGEVYATTLASVDWTTGSVKCWNYSEVDGDYLQLSELEGWGKTGALPGSGTGGGPGGIAYTNLTIPITSVDGVNETFVCYMCNNSASAPASALHSSFYVGGQLIDGATLDSLTGVCPVAKMYNSTGTRKFEEVLLYDNQAGTANDFLIYTSILQQSEPGFNGAPADFEMLVGENGHNGDTGVTTYYFYVELE